MSTTETHTFTPDMGEISGFGGGYEDACRKMMIFGLDWLRTHPPADAETVSEAEWDALRDAVGDSEDGCSGAMVGVTSQHALYAYRHGWEAYKAKRQEAHAKYVEETPAREAEEARRQEEMRARGVASRRRITRWLEEVGTWKPLSDEDVLVAEGQATMLPWRGIHFYEKAWHGSLGVHVSEAASDLCLLAATLNKRFEVDWNGKPLYAEPGDESEAVQARWWEAVNAEVSGG